MEVSSDVGNPFVPQMITGSISADFSSAWLRLGALVVVLSIAADPLNQQLIQYKQRVIYTRDAGTMISRAGRYARGNENWNVLSDDDRYWTADIDFSMKSAILYGMVQPMKNVLQQSNFNCPTGNCTWPPFESLAVCNRCTDVTARLESFVPRQWDNVTTTFILPNGLIILNENGWEYGTAGIFHTDDGSPLIGGYLMTALGTDNASETITAHDLDTIIWSMSMIRVRPNGTTVTWPNLPLSAMECTLFYCVNSYEVEVSNGTLIVTSDQIMDAKRAANSWDPGEDQEGLGEFITESIAFQEDGPELYHTDLMLISPMSGSRFNISQSAVDSISSYYGTTFPSKTFFGANLTNSNTSRMGWLEGYYKNYSYLQYRPSIMQPLFDSQDLDATFTALATSMSNAIRSGADEIFEGVSNIVTGSKGDVTTFYRVVWPWISLHCFIVAAGMVFLLLTIRENKRHGWMVPTWKSSSLAVLNRGQEVAGILSGMQTIEQMEVMSKTSQVMLFDKTAYSSSLEHLAFDPLEVES